MLFVSVATKSNIEFDGITVKGDKLIGYVLNDSNFNEKNAIKRDEITNLGKKINNMQLSGFCFKYSFLEL